MQTIDADQIGAVEEPDGIVVKVNVVEPISRAVLASTSDDATTKLEILDGSRLSVDGAADIARTLSLELNSEDLIPLEATDLLHPVAGNEIEVFVGVRKWTSDGITEGVIPPPKAEDHYWPQGVFSPFDVDVEHTDEGLKLSIECDDRAAHVRDNPWGKPKLFDDGPANTQLTDMLVSRYRQAIYSWAAEDDTVPQVLVGMDTRNDPLADIRAVARRVSRRLLVDVQGTFVTRPIPNVDTDASVWTFGPGSVQRVNRSLSLREVFNTVLLEVESPVTRGTDARGFRVGAFDDRPNSPTRRNGPIGQRTLRERATKAMTIARAQQAVNARLLEVQGLPEEVRITSRLNPALEENDVVTIVDDETGTKGQSLLEKFSYDLYSATMEATPKSRRILTG